METASDRLQVYRELADAYDRLGQVSMRDRFLILAADAALESGQAGEAERLRQRLLQTSRYHMLRPYASFAEAAEVEDVQTYLHDLRVNYPLSVAQQLLDSLQPLASAPVATPLPRETAYPVAEAAPVIPPTAPVVDLYGRGSSGPTWQPTGARPGPARLETAPNKPLAQPLPGRTPTPNGQQPRKAPGAPKPPADVYPLVRPLPVAEPVVPATSAEGERSNPGSWLSFVLGGLVLTAALALAVFTLARPYLNPRWFF